MPIGATASAEDVRRGRYSAAWYAIRIVPVNSSDPAGPAEFEPQGERPGRPLEAWVGDTVTWNNTTDAAHWPWPTEANYQPLNVQRGDLGYMSQINPADFGNSIDMDLKKPRRPGDPPEHRLR